MKIDMTTNPIPTVDWVPCNVDLPEEGKFIWALVGRTIESGDARRYEREVHMAIFRGGMSFELFPYKEPMCSNSVWAWANMVPPAVPVIRKKVESEDQ